MELYKPRTWSFDHESKFQREIDGTAAPIFERMKIEDSTTSKKLFCKAQIGMALSIKKVLDLIISFEHKWGRRYDSILVARPDVLLTEPLHLDFGVSNNSGTQEENTSANVIWNTRGYGRRGDFHFRMSSKNARIFQRIFADFSLLSKCEAHTGWIQDFCEMHGLRLVSDNGGVFGYTEEVYRKAKPEFWMRVAASLNDTALNVTKPPSMNMSTVPRVPKARARRRQG